ncbi:Leukotriene-A4 hydrolase [Forsythia ovata]|uniref:Leukotriene-A4 hydrolase n=1 Tax=Forsythia ovata TaxID=205694 RepID=A0ABD1XF88_9LAMI
MNEVVDHEDLISDDAIDGMIFGSSEAAKQFIEELERGSGGGSRIDGQIVIDSKEEADTDEKGDGKELFDSAALAALLKAATFLMFEKPTSHHPKPTSLHPRHCYRPNFHHPKPNFIHLRSCYRPDFGPINYYYPLKSIPAVDFVENYPLVINPSMAFAATNDTHAARIMYTAKLNVPRYLSAIMAAKHVERRDPVAGKSLGACEDHVWCEEGRVVEEFVMK